MIRYLRADQCWPCHLHEKHGDAVLADAAGRSRLITCVAEVNGDPRSAIGFSLDIGDEPLRGWLAAVLGERSPPEALSERTEAVLTNGEARAIHTWCEQRIDEGLRTYEHATDVAMDFSAPATFSWRGVEHTIQRKFNPVGEELSRLFASHRLVGDAVGRGVLRVLGNGSITERDARFLAKLRVHPLTPDELRAAFPVLPLDEVEKTLSKLEARGFVAREGGVVRPLLKGRFANIAGP